MINHAYKKDIPGVGWIVEWCDENCLSIPLRNFGDCQSAAIEFAKMINDYTGDNLDRYIRSLAESYDPAKIYTYPQRAEGRPAILRLRHGTY